MKIEQDDTDNVGERFVDARAHVSCRRHGNAMQYSILRTVEQNSAFTGIPKSSLIDSLLYRF